MTICRELSPLARLEPSGSRRIALVCLHTSPLALPGVGDAGGMNVYLRYVADALAQEGHQVDVYTRATSLLELERGTEPLGAATLHYLRAGPAAPLDKSQLPAVAPDFAAAMERYPRADVIHSHYWLSGLAGQEVAKVWRVPHVQSLHTVASMKNRGLAPGETPETVERLQAELDLTQNAEAVVTVSQAEKDAIVRDYGVVADSITVASPGVDGAIFHPGPPPELDSLPVKLRRAAGYLLMVGRVQPIKGQDLAISALALLDQERRPALLVTGAPGQGHLEYAAHLRVLARELGVEGDVEFMGPQPAPRLAELIRGGRAALV
ncbi:MAG: glycosyltransferase, partial [Bifidobacteriaceae bacterium]|nr:glycosyltransferase [Bifidobacteriaceae bacterium]